MPRDEGVVFINGVFDDVHDPGRGGVSVQHVGDLVKIEEILVAAIQEGLGFACRLTVV